MTNEMTIKFLSISENENFARLAVQAFVLPLNPDVAELSDIKTAVSEAVTNCIVHGYPDSLGYVTIEATIDGNDLHIKIKDEGVGIQDIDRAIEPFFTTKPDEERSGMGFTIMRSFMDKLDVHSKLNGGTVVEMSKRLSVG